MASNTKKDKEYNYAKRITSEKFDKLNERENNQPRR